MYLEYFDKFKGMTPYLEIDEKEWEYIKETFEKDDVKEVREGMECGIRLEGFNDVKEGDILEAYREDVRKRTFESS